MRSFSDLTSAQSRSGLVPHLLGHEAGDAGDDGFVGRNVESQPLLQVALAQLLALHPLGGVGRRDERIRRRIPQRCVDAVQQPLRATAGLL